MSGSSGAGQAGKEPQAPAQGWLGMVERVTAALARAGAWVGAGIVLMMALFAGYGIFTRYVFDHPQTWVDELSGYLLVLMVMLGAAEALRRSDHIAVDILLQRIGPAGQRRVEVLGLVAVLVVAIVIFLSAWSDVGFAFRMDEIGEGYLALPKWIPMSSLLIGMALLVLAAIDRLLRLVLHRP